MTAADLINGGFIDDACEQLQDAYNRCDDEFPPADFVEGKRAELAVIDPVGGI